MRLFWLNGSVVIEPQSQEEREALRVVSESFAGLVRRNFNPPGRVDGDKIPSSSDLIGINSQVV